MVKTLKHKWFKYIDTLKCKRNIQQVNEFKSCQNQHETNVFAAFLTCKVSKKNLIIR